MREIKFRGKRIDNGEWVYGDLIQGDKVFIVIDTKINDYYGDGSELYSTDWYEVIPETVGQYTGLKDKNGKEIYEGDIITGGDGNVPTQILWVDEYGGWGAKNLKRNEIHALDKYFKRFIGEIIGNIHDNPELLEVL